MGYVYCEKKKRSVVRAGRAKVFSLKKKKGAARAGGAKVLVQIGLAEMLVV